MVYIILYIACVAGCFYLAKQKNRDIGLWTILGVLFGLIPLIVLIFLPVVEKGKKTPNKKTK